MTEVRTLPNEDFADRDGLLGGVAPPNGTRRDDVGFAPVIQVSPAFLKKENEFVAGTVVIARADYLLVPQEAFPELESGGFRYRLHDERRLLIAEDIEVAVPFQHAPQLTEQIWKATVGKYPEPVVARRLALLQPRRRSDGPVLF